jgi:membrane protein required for colicin V production
MATLDWIFAVVVLASLLLGVWRGLVFEVISVISWVAAFVLAQWFAPQVAGHLPMAGAGESIRYAAAFVLVFVASVFAGGLIAFLVAKLVSTVGLRPVDRILGAAFGAVRGVVVLLAITIVVNMTPLKENSQWKASQGAHSAEVVVAFLKPLLPQEFGKYLAT